MLRCWAVRLTLVNCIRYNLYQTECSINLGAANFNTSYTVFEVSLNVDYTILIKIILWIGFATIDYYRHFQSSDSSSESNSKFR